MFRYIVRAMVTTHARQRDAAARNEARILDTTRALLQDDDAGAVDIRDIARAAGVGVGTGGCGGGGVPPPWGQRAPRWPPVPGRPGGGRGAPRLPARRRSAPARR